MRWIRDNIVSQPSLSRDPLSHFNDSRAAKEEIEHIVKGLTLFDDGLRVSRGRFSDEQRHGFGMRVCSIPEF